MSLQNRRLRGNEQKVLTYLSKSNRPMEEVLPWQHLDFVICNTFHVVAQLRLAEARTALLSTDVLTFEKQYKAAGATCSIGKPQASNTHN